MYVGLKEYLEEKGYSQQRIASILDVSVPYVNGILVGSKTLGKKGAKKWANLFGLSENFLLTGKGSPDPMKDVEYQKQVFNDNIQKANRFVAALNYLVDEGFISNHLAVAPILKVTEAVVSKAKNYDPEGKYDFLFVRLVHEYPFISLEWLLLGDGEMIQDNRPNEYQENMEGKMLQMEDNIVSLEYQLEKANNTIESLDRELKAVKDDSDSKNITIKTQQELIEQYKLRIQSLELENSKLKSKDILKDFHFPVGVADKENVDNAHV